ncbi:hypothetical protein NDU88_003211 [Pleurodeles waltl]|uniref:Uncharacterized protein n=1 Tax=Pleurodeles waltl TaxID=8319 RepID=A0AAV7SFG0_PLEWA|nr:hypothetical protein NDU88_003211 [Pleurodeles waltl]
MVQVFVVFWLHESAGASSLVTTGGSNISTLGPITGPLPMPLQTSAVARDLLQASTLAPRSMPVPAAATSVSTPPALKDDSVQTQKSDPNRFGIEVGRYCAMKLQK